MASGPVRFELESEQARVEGWDPDRLNEASSQSLLPPTEQELRLGRPDLFQRAEVSPLGQDPAVAWFDADNDRVVRFELASIDRYDL